VTTFSRYLSPATSPRYSVSGTTEKSQLPRYAARKIRSFQYTARCIISPHQLDKDSCKADYVEFAFQDQYLGRNEMWRLGQQLVGKCVYVDQDILFIGVIAAKVTAIYVGGHRVGVGLFLPFDPGCADILDSDWIRLPQAA